MTIRTYQPDDRASVRHICCETAVGGKPVEQLFADREAAADLITAYYTDHEPGSTLVAEENGRIVGYLTGCLDNRRYSRLMHREIVPQTVLRAIARGALVRLDTWRFLGAAVRTWQRGGFNRRTSLTRYPAHLHVNIDQGFRRHRLGHALVERFVQQVGAAGLSGVCATVRGDNLPACRFFEQLGFVPASRHPVVLPMPHGFRLLDSIIYGRQI